ncbi:hypothetical protein ACFQL3_18530 [Natronoarchaeum sp. GCM10025321]|uniref:hypothetical protein n=1 Tax=Natronoarchaeum sp. GCM10025321 TaxID=3252684 RepID=UPI003620714A
MNDDHTRLYATLATCFQHPDEAFVDAVRNGTLGTIVAECAASLPIDSVDAPPRFEDIARARREYLRTFEAFEGEYAPPRRIRLRRVVGRHRTRHPLGTAGERHEESIRRA